MTNKKTSKERPYEAFEYDELIRQTLPYNQDLYEQAISMIKRYGNPSGSLLDVGCGAGMFEKLLREAFPELTVVAVDPAEDMLNYAKSRGIDRVVYRKGTILDVEEPDSYDLVTAIMSHHFYREEQREHVLERVYRTLKKGGLYIAFENVLPDDPYFKETELDRWMNFQIQAGKSEEDAAIHRERCGKYYFPLSPERHAELLKQSGFSHVYVFWRSYMQMGLLAVK